MAKGDQEQGLREIASESDESERRAAFAAAYQILGRVSEARAALTQLQSSQGNGAAYQVAQIYALRKDSQQTFQWLERAYQQHEYLMRIKVDPWFASIRADSRYRVLLRRLSLPE